MSQLSFGPPGDRAGRRTSDPVAWLSLAVAVAGLVAMVLVSPSLLPAPLRELVGLAPERLASAPDVDGIGTYAFMAHQPNDPDAPVAYDPCRPLKVRINPELAPPGGVEIVREAMDRVSAATGLVLQYDGSTTERPRWDNEFAPSFLGQVRTRPALVSWAEESEVPELEGDVAGIGGSLAVRTELGPARYVTGGVTLDAATFRMLADRPDGAAEMRAIVLHELGHLVGLAHVDDPNELMHGDNLGLLDFGPGDRAGLARVGSGSCR